MQQGGPHVSIERPLSALYVLWTETQGPVDAKVKKTLKQIERDEAKEERESSKGWFEKFKILREQEMEMKMEDSLSNVLDRMIASKTVMPTPACVKER